MTIPEAKAMIDSAKTMEEYRAKTLQIMAAYGGFLPPWWDIEMVNTGIAAAKTKELLRKNQPFNI